MIIMIITTVHVYRLTPPYMLVLMVGTVLVPFFMRGAMQPEGDDLFMAECRTKWWTNLLYVNNYVIEDNKMVIHDSNVYLLKAIITGVSHQSFNYKITFID